MTTSERRNKLNRTKRARRLKRKMRELQHNQSRYAALQAKAHANTPSEASSAELLSFLTEKQHG